LSPGTAGAQWAQNSLTTNISMTVTKFNGEYDKAAYHNKLVPSKKVTVKVKVAHTRLPSVGFHS